MSHGHVPGPRRIVLVGFMASGKSTVGRLLADRIGWEFVDLDELVTARAGMPPAELIRSRGEPAFRELEDAAAAELAARSGVVVAAGGGWGTGPGGSSDLGRGTVRVWLRVSAAEAVRRAAGDDVDRPLLGDPADPAARRRRAEELIQAREPVYGLAELVVDVDGKAPAAVAGEIAARLELLREDDER